MTFLILANLTLAFVLAVSGVAKLRAPAETRDAFDALRLPGWLRRSPAPALLPWVELALAVVLALGASWIHLLGAIGALALFAAYAVIIGGALTFDEPVRCACFGALGSHDVSTRTLVRNIVLLILAVLGVWAAWLGLTTWSLDLTGWGWVAVAAAAAAAVALSLGGARAAAPAGRSDWIANAVLRDTEANRDVPIRSLAAEHDGAVLLFVLPGCGGCERVLEQLPDWKRAGGGPSVILATAPGGRPSGWASLGVYEDPGFNIARSLSQGFTPTAVQLGRDGVPIGEVAIGFEPVRHLISGIAPEPVAEPEPEPVVEEEDEADYIRRPIPEGVLIDPDGAPVTTRELAAQRPQLLIGIDCLCAPAREAIAGLEQFQERLPILDVRLVVPFRLEPTTLTRPQERMALYDHAGLASRRLGLLGQTSAVLLGADGLLAGGPVEGIDGVKVFVSDIEEQILAAELPDTD